MFHLFQATLVVLLVTVAELSVSAIAAEGAAANAGAHLEERNRQGGKYRLAAADLSQRIIWGATCELPDGTGLLFGGLDQDASDGSPHTQIKQGAAWLSIREDLEKANSLQAWHVRAWAVRQLQKNATAYARHIYFEGLPEEEEKARLKLQFVPAMEQVGKDLAKLLAGLKDTLPQLKEYDAGQARLALSYLEDARKRLGTLAQSLTLSPAQIGELSAIQVLLEKAAEALGAEPPPRALSPIAYDAKTKLFVIFGGDHLDYLTNDTWVFDPARKRWFQRHPQQAPLPRANHQLNATGDGKIAMSGGFHYASAFWDFKHYKDAEDGDWVYDVASDTWTGAKGALPDSRSYHASVFHPDHFLGAPKPNAAETAATLKSIPANTWTPLTPPKLPNGPRDWGTVALDPDHDLILWFSGGHSDHGGADVMHYHLSTNRWELPTPVDIPLGEVGNSAAYPGGYNFNLRTWIPGHTYRSYGYDPVSKKMLYVGRSFVYNKKTQDTHFYWYEPEIGDWADRALKPTDMFSINCMLTNTFCGTPRGSFCWTRLGKLFQFEATKAEWQEAKLSGALPGTVCDGACMVFDSKRNRLLGIRTEKWQAKYDGEVYSVDLQNLQVKPLAPAEKPVTNGLTYIREAAYDVENDVMLVISTLPGAKDQVPVYDCTQNRWVAVRLAGESPIGPTFNYSLGLAYDSKRKLFWMVGQRGQIYVLRLDWKTVAKPGEEGK